MVESAKDQIDQYEKHSVVIQKLLDESKVQFSSIMGERISEIKEHEKFLLREIKKQKIAHDVEIERLNNIKFHSVKIYEELDKQALSGKLIPAVEKVEKDSDKKQAETQKILNCFQIV